MPCMRHSKPGIHALMGAFRGHFFHRRSIAVPFAGPDWPSDQVALFLRPQRKPSRRGIALACCADRNWPQAIPLWMLSRFLPERQPGILEENCGSGQRLEELAARLGCSSRHLRRVFLEEYNVTPVQYLQTCRLLLAKIC